jgi:hypothetical protein
MHPVAHLGYTCIYNEIERIRQALDSVLNRVCFSVDFNLKQEDN